MKKICLLLLAMVLTLCMVACGEEETSWAGKVDSSAEETVSVSQDVSPAQSQAVSDTSSQEEAEITFRVTAVDQDGNPVANVFVQLCDDSTCTPMMTDAQGIAAFTLEITAECHLSVLSAPAGYVYEGEKDLPLEAGATEYTITLTKEA